MKTRRQKANLKIAIICFTIAALALIGLIMEASNCYAGQDTTSKIAKQAFFYTYEKGEVSFHTRIANTKDLVTLYGVSSVIVDGKRIKSPYITHSDKFLFANRPPEQLKGGSANALFPVWLSFLTPVTVEKPGKIVTLAKSNGSANITIQGYVKVISKEHWALCKRMRVAWEQQKKANAAKGQ